MKKKLICIVLSAFWQVGWAVTDGPAQVQRHAIFIGQMAKMNEEIKHFVEMIKQYKQQLEQMKSTVNALKGTEVSSSHRS